MARAKSIKATYRWLYNIPPHIKLNASIYEMEVELLARSYAQDIKKYGEENVNLYDTDMSLDDMDSLLSDLSSDNQREEVSLNEVMEELGNA